jgi:hypothetical protein
MDAIIQAILFVLDLVIPDKDQRYRRLQRIGCFLFGALAFITGGYLLIDVILIGNN